jgi:hypothetical protein
LGFLRGQLLTIQKMEAIINSNQPKGGYFHG